MPEQPNKPPINSIVKAAIEAVIQYIPQKHKRLAGIIGTAATLTCHNYGLIDFDVAKYVGGFFFGVALVGFAHADVKTDKNVAALESQLAAVKEEMGRITGQ